MKDVFGDFSDQVVEMKNLDTLDEVEIFENSCGRGLRAIGPAEPGEVVSGPMDSGDACYMRLNRTHRCSSR